MPGAGVENKRYEEGEITMKIIGKTNDGFIFEATKSELEKLENTYYGNGVYKIGTTIQIHKMYD